MGLDQQEDRVICRFLGTCVLWIKLKCFLKGMAPNMSSRMNSF